VCASGIARVALTFPFRDLSLAGDASLQARADFLAGCLLERIGAGGQEQGRRDREYNRQGPHSLILGMKRGIANFERWISNSHR
jgi:hypothetical protein